MPAGWDCLYGVAHYCPSSDGVPIRKNVRRCVDNSTNGCVHHQSLTVVLISTGLCVMPFVLFRLLRDMIRAIICIPVKRDTRRWRHVFRRNCFEGLMLQGSCTVATKALYGRYKGFVASLQGPCTKTTRPLYKTELCCMIWQIVPYDME